MILEFLLVIVGEEAHKIHEECQWAVNYFLNLGHSPALAAVHVIELYRTEQELHARRR